MKAAKKTKKKVATARANKSKTAAVKAKKSKAVAGQSTGQPQSLIHSHTYVWPQERDVMLRPDRINYVRQIRKPEGCVFCKARDMGVQIDSLCLYKNKHAMIILNKYPYNSGHVMVLPTRHCGDITELSDDEYFEMQRLVRRVVNVIKSEYPIQGLNIGLNMGAVAGAGLPDHLHWHLIPRWQGDTNFFPLIAETKVLAQTLEQVYERYSKYDYEGDK